MSEKIEKLKQLVWDSGVFDARKKWAIIKHINQNELAEAQINQMIEVFQNETEYGKQASEKTDQEYLQNLKQWQKELEHIIKNVIPQYRVKQENLANQEDAQVGEDLLKTLNNL